MELHKFDPKPFLSCGIDEKAVQAVQVLKHLDTYSSINQNKFFIEDKLSCSNTDQPEKEEEFSSAHIMEMAKNDVLVTGFLIGFKVVETKAVDLLAERTLNYLDMMCRQLSVLADRRRRGRPCAFVNVMHQVLSMNNLSIPILHSFYCSTFLNLCNSPLKRFYKIEGNKEKSENSKNKSSCRKRKASNMSLPE